MKTLNWRHTDWASKKFIFLIGHEIIGHLNFNSIWNYNAVYTDKETKLKFTQTGFWRGNVSISRDEQVIGEIKSGIFNKQILKLRTNEEYQLVSNFWGKDAHWKDSSGETIIKYQQVTMSSMGSGRIELKDTLPMEVAKLLISSGVFVKQLILKRTIMTVAIFVAISAVLRR